MLNGVIRKYINELRKNNTINRAIKSYDLNNMPLFEEIEVETLNRCNGKCSFCPVNANEPQRTYKKMSVKMFEKIIGELERIEYSGKISLFSNNEPFLDERIIDFHRYAREKLSNAHFSLYTNGSLLSLKNFLEIEPYLDELHIDNYNDHKEVNSGLKEIYDYLKENERLNKKVTFHVRLENEVLYSRGGQAPNKKGSKPAKYKCMLPYRMVIVRPDGKVSLCCNDALGKYTMGDLEKQSLVEIWNGKQFYEVRSKMRKYGRKRLYLCNECDTFTFPTK